MNILKNIFNIVWLLINNQILIFDSDYFLYFSFLIFFIFFSKALYKSLYFIYEVLKCF